MNGLFMVKQDEPTRVYEWISRWGAVLVCAAASAAIALFALVTVVLTHQLTGAPMQGVDYFNTLVLPFLIGFPLLLLTAHLITRLEDARSELLHHARFDPTTGAYNRRYLIECAESLCQHARQTGGAVSLILIDADQFKQTNDEFGHPAGDAVLRRLVRIIHALIDPGEFYGRYGGEEFAIFLPDVTLDKAGIRADKIRRAFEVGEVVFRGQTIKSTISMGVACCSGAEATVNRLVARADSALYAAKRGGRNRTELAVSS